MTGSTDPTAPADAEAWTLARLPASRVAIEAILTRRSVREGFTGQPIPRSVLAEIVRCGCAAPSAKNTQPWRFHVVA